MGFGHPRLEGPTLILLQLLNECVLHLHRTKKNIRVTANCEELLATYLSEEGRVEFVPFGRLEVSLLQHCGLAKDVD